MMRWLGTVLVVGLLCQFTAAQDEIRTCEFPSTSGLGFTLNYGCPAGWRTEGVPFRGENATRARAYVHRQQNSIRSLAIAFHKLFVPINYPFSGSMLIASNAADEARVRASVLAGAPGVAKTYPMRKVELPGATAYRFGTEFGTLDRGTAAWYLGNVIPYSLLKHISDRYGEITKAEIRKLFEPYQNIRVEQAVLSFQACEENAEPPREGCDRDGEGLFILAYMAPAASFDESFLDEVLKRVKGGWGNLEFKIVDERHAAFSGAQVYVDDELKALSTASPLRLSQLPAGPRRILVRAGKYKDFERLVEVPRRGTILVPVQLRRLELSKSEVLEALRSGVSAKRVVALVREYKVDFSITPALEQELRAAGATDEVLAAILGNKR